MAVYHISEPGYSLWTFPAHGLALFKVQHSFGRPPSAWCGCRVVLEHAEYRRYSCRSCRSRREETEIGKHRVLWLVLLERIHQVCPSTLGTSTRDSCVESEAGSSRRPAGSIEGSQTCACIEARRTTTCGGCEPDLITPLPLFINFTAVGLKFECNLCR